MSRFVCTLAFVGIVALFIAGLFGAFALGTLIGGDIVQVTFVMTYLLGALGVVFYLKLGE